ncbi:hypothetical protein AXG93_2958s1380 [Marchantia polymorpha subsp. ruderalis]|uniref:Uncharacterized protein n=1 Tax=Marchantia polymorpha subsp. ruderalis TaxID=1480154 RepID=A0A176VHB4_MARPO|nr:hypothetical protein AXG93_2958s1380 [Marchantia polymorpha subsp. ruderalis]
MGLATDRQFMKGRAQGRKFQHGHRVSRSFVLPKKGNGKGTGSQKRGQAARPDLVVGRVGVGSAAERGQQQQHDEGTRAAFRLAYNVLETTADKHGESASLSSGAQHELLQFGVPFARAPCAPAPSVEVWRCGGRMVH